MKFYLTYDGELRANGTPAQKMAIREALSPQLEELWQVDPVLVTLRKRRYLTPAAFMVVEQHHTTEVLAEQPKDCPEGAIDFCSATDVLGWQFIPLIRDVLAMRCALKIIFLRKEEPGRVYQGGDMDNRLKTLFDALAVPTKGEINALSRPSSGQTAWKRDRQQPLYCLLQDDALIANLSVETGRLLSQPGASHHEVRLIIEVDTRITQARLYNLIFLGS